jgi:hypothetical protein
MMESLTETEEFTAIELKEINRCRIYLRVFYISDIASHDGQGIAEREKKRTARCRKEVVMGMASSAVTHLVESLETGTRPLSTRRLCYSAIRRLV